jgi:hypothetical protein
MRLHLPPPWIPGLKGPPNPSALKQAANRDLSRKRAQRRWSSDQRHSNKELQRFDAVSSGAKASGDLDEIVVALGGAMLKRFADGLAATSRLSAPHWNVPASNSFVRECFTQHDVAKAMRWILRGLQPRHAVCKVLVDREISTSALNKRCGAEVR